MGPGTVLQNYEKNGGKKSHATVPLKLQFVYLCNGATVLEGLVKDLGHLLPVVLLLARRILVMLRIRIRLRVPISLRGLVRLRGLQGGLLLREEPLVGVPDDLPKLWHLQVTITGSNTIKSFNTIIAKIVLISTNTEKIHVRNLIFFEKLKFSLLNIYIFARA